MYSVNRSEAKNGSSQVRRSATAGRSLATSTNSAIADSLASAALVTRMAKPSASCLRMIPFAGGVVRQVVQVLQVVAVRAPGRARRPRPGARRGARSGRVVQVAPLQLHPGQLERRAQLDAQHRGAARLLVRPGEQADGVLDAARPARSAGRASPARRPPPTGRQAARAASRACCARDRAGPSSFIDSSARAWVARARARSQRGGSSRQRVDRRLGRGDARRRPRRCRAGSTRAARWPGRTAPGRPGRRRRGSRSAGAAGARRAAISPLVGGAERGPERELAAAHPASASPGRATRSQSDSAWS